jgi:hypothetical protein
VLEKMKAARDMYSRFQRRVKRLESCYKAKDVSGVSDAVAETEQSLKQADELIATQSKSQETYQNLIWASHSQLYLSHGKLPLPQFQHPSLHLHPNLHLRLNLHQLPNLHPLM